MVFIKKQNKTCIYKLEMLCALNTVRLISNKAVVFRVCLEGL